MKTALLVGVLCLTSLSYNVAHSHSHSHHKYDSPATGNPPNGPSTGYGQPGSSPVVGYGPPSSYGPPSGPAGTPPSSGYMPPSGNGNTASPPSTGPNPGAPPPPGDTSGGNPPSGPAGTPPSTYLPPSGPAGAPPPPGDTSGGNTPSGPAGTPPSTYLPPSGNGNTTSPPSTGPNPGAPPPGDTSGGNPPSGPAGTPPSTYLPPGQPQPGNNGTSPAGNSMCAAPLCPPPASAYKYNKSQTQCPFQAGGVAGCIDIQTYLTCPTVNGAVVGDVDILYCPQGTFCAPYGVLPGINVDSCVSYDQEKCPISPGYGGSAGAPPPPSGNSGSGSPPPDDQSGKNPPQCTSTVTYTTTVGSNVCTPAPGDKDGQVSPSYGNMAPQAADNNVPAHDDPIVGSDKSDPEQGNITSPSSNPITTNGTGGH